MPCFTWPNDRPEDELRKVRAELEAMLCYAMRTLEDKISESTLCELQIEDIAHPTREAKCGVSAADVLLWWQDHKAADVAREKAEKAEAKRKAELEAVLRKLTKKERKLLGIK